MMQGSHQKEKEALIAREGMEESRRSHPNMMSHPVMLRSHFRSLSLTSCFLFSYSLVNLPMFSILDMERKTFCPGPVCRPYGATLVSQHCGLSDLIHLLDWINELLVSFA